MLRTGRGRDAVFYGGRAASFDLEVRIILFSRCFYRLVCSVLDRRRRRLHSSALRRSGGVFISAFVASLLDPHYLATVRRARSQRYRR